MTMTSAELPLAWFPLADAVAKATLVLTIAAVASVALRRASAALRHLVWTVALCSALALPLLSVSLPRWQLSIFRVAVDTPVPADAGQQGRLADTIEPAREKPLPSSPRARTAETTTAARPEPPAAGRLDWVRAISWQQALFACWLAGAGAIVIRMLIGLAAVSWLSRRTQRIADAPWLPMARALASELGVTARLRFLRSGHATMPIATGIFRPSVIMPADADRWPESRLRIVLLHELAHVKRRDCLTHLLAQAACALHWFNPLAWVAAKRVRTERERACDDLVLASGTRGSEYANQLLEIARAMQGDRFPGLLAGASLAMAHRSQLEGRLIAILDPGVPRAGLSRARALMVVAIAAAAVAPLGALQPWTIDDPASTIVSTDEVSAKAAAVVDPIVATNAPLAAVTESESAQKRMQDAGATRPVPRAVTGERFAEAIPSIVRSAADSLAVSGISEAVGSALAEAVASQAPNPNPNPNPNPQSAQNPRRGKNQPADPRLVAALTAALKDTDKGVREAALQALVELRDPAVFDPLVQALKDASPDVRERAAFGLGELRDRRAVPALLAALKDENAEVRERAVFALGELRDRSAVEGLAAALRDADAEVREQAAFALGEIRDPRAVMPLIAALKDENPEVRERAVFALGELRDRTAVEPLAMALKDPNAGVREHVAFALGEIRDPRAIEALTEALKDKSADVRQKAAFALGQLAR
jgi:HEAT repeat protein/beta-lactamase regulating signal transducer with metallopeptidase domain